MNKASSTRQTIAKSILTLLTMLVSLAAVYYVFLFLYTSILRIPFPLTLDWIESASLVEANRILLGQKLYVEPDIHYVPLVYPPLYFYIIAVVIKLFGLGLMPVRLISVFATCGCILSILMITKKTSGSLMAGLISAGLFAATNEIGQMWFDIARVDMLCIFFFMAGLYWMLRDDWRASILTGVLFSLSFFTKQNTAPIILLALAYSFFVSRRQTFISMLTFGLLVGTGTALLTYESNGLYLFYTYKLPTYHRISDISYILAKTEELLQPVLIVVGLILFSTLANLKKILQDRYSCLLLLAASSTVALSQVGAVMVGSAHNAYIPAYAMMAVLFGTGLHHLKENIERLSSSNFRFIGFLGLMGICLLQFAVLQYNAADYIPSTQDFKQAEMVINSIKANKDEALMPTQNYLALYANKKVYYHVAALGEFNGMYGRVLPQWETIKKEIRETIRSKEVNFVYLSSVEEIWLGMSCTKIDSFRFDRKFIKPLHKMSCH